VQNTRNNSKTKNRKGERKMTEEEKKIMKEVRRIREELSKTEEPIPIDKFKHITLDIQGLMRYAKNKGKKPMELSDEEAVKFIKIILSQE
jgi:hypothetical protein